MRTVKNIVRTTPQTTVKHHEWQLVPHPVHPDCFNLEEAKTGKILCSLALPEGGNPTFLNLITSAPELQVIAERYMEAMRDSRAKNDILFSMVKAILRCVAQPRAVEVALWI